MDPRAVLILSVFIIVAQLKVVSSSCPNRCTGNGICGLHAVCECFHGYIGADCSLRTCPTGRAWSDYATADDVTHGEEECSSRGHCNRDKGLCECDPYHNMFEGSACERLKCPNDCNNRGRCVSMKTLAMMQDPGAIRSDCSSLDVCIDGPCTTANYAVCQKTFKYTEPWDAKKIHGCHCDEGFTGFDCSVRTCMQGDDPLTTGQVDEVHLIECKASGGSFTLTFKDETSKSITWDATEIAVKTALSNLATLKSYGDSNAIRVAFNPGPKACGIATANDIQVTFSQMFGGLPLIIPDGSKLQHSSAGVFPLITSQKIQTGTKESDECSNRGFCSRVSGYCTCMDGWGPSDGANGAGIRDDCGHEIVTQTSCPGAPDCLNHGTCSGAPEYRCDCVVGRRGHDCSLFECPKGRSWFSFPSADDIAHEFAECSNMGICDQNTGLCHCAKGFEGAACEEMSCPGQTLTTAECNGNGICLTIEQLARDYNSIDGTPVSFTYGTVPNDPFTWDHDKIKGCHCSVGWEGYDCSLRSCPHGDDPNTEHQDNEVQTITCTLTNPSDTLQVELLGESFSIGVQSTVADFVSAIESLDSIRRVKGYYTDTNIYVGAPAMDPDALHICRVTPDADWSIEFESPTGDIPLMSISSALGGVTISVVETTKGTKEYVECSSRGLCDHKTGKCECFTGFASSNGQGKAGTYDDCGYRSPYILGT